MEIHNMTGLLAGALTIISALPYLRDVLRGKTKLERGAYTIWLALPLTALFAQIVEGAAVSSLGFAVGDSLIALIFFILMFKYGYGGVARRDAAALVLAGIGLLLWWVTDQPLLALCIAILVDAIGIVLVTIKSYEAPATETTSSWAIYLLAAIFGILSLETVTWLFIAYPLYAAISAVVVLTAQYMGFRKVS